MTGRLFKGWQLERFRPWKQEHTKTKERSQRVKNSSAPFQKQKPVQRKVQREGPG